MIFTNNLIDLSALIVAFTALLIYFGKIIADTKVEKFEKTDLVISGLFFVLIFILFPVALSAFFYQKGWVIQITPWMIVLFHLAIMGVYARYKAYKDIKKFQLEKEYDKRFNKKIDEIKKTKPILNYFIKQRPELLNQSRNLFDNIFRFFENSKVLLLISVAIFYSVLITFDASNILLIITIAILSFINLSMIAIAYGTSTAYYPPSKITLVDGKTYKGRTIKFGDFIYIVKKDKKYFINKDQVKVIEQDIMKKKNEETQIQTN